MICAKCGASNAAGDAFCGSCGAFLEFAAEAATAPAPEVVAPAPRPAPEAAQVAVSPAPLQAAPPVAPSPFPTAGPTGPTGPTCPACGRANPVGRTFCISCGERLAAAGLPLAGASRAAPPPPVPQAAAAPLPVAAAAPATPPVAAPRPTPTGPAWEFPTAPARPVAAPAAKPGASPVAPVPSARRGRNPLPLIVGAGVLCLLLAGGGAAILLGSGSGRATPAPGNPGASAGTSAAAGGPLSGAASAEPSAASGAAGQSAAAATVPPGPAIGLTLTGATASSSLAKHPASAAIDGDPTTAWLTGTSSAADQWLEVAFAPAAITQIQLWNGWQRTQDFFSGNLRPHNVTIRFDSGTPIPLELKDVYGSQRVDIPPELGIVGVTRLRIRILDWYAAKKTSAAGSPSTHAAISDIRLYGIPMTP